MAQRPSKLGSPRENPFLKQSRGAGRAYYQDPTGPLDSGKISPRTLEGIDLSGESQGRAA